MNSANVDAHLEVVVMDAGDLRFIPELPIYVTLHDAADKDLDRFGVRDQRRIQVVAREDPNHLLGVLHAWDVVNSYRAKLIRSEERAADASQ